MQDGTAAPVVVASKLWNIVRIVVFMLKKGIAKGKTKLDLNLLVKRGKIAAGKAIAGSIMLHHHYAAFTCRSQDSHLSFISPSDYEFSCSNSPTLPFRAITNTNKHKHKPYKYDDVSACSAFRKVLVDNPEVANSPSGSLSGFGKSPIGRQLRITDSPFPLKDDDDRDAQVDKAAEEFIKKFYTNLNLQKTMSASDSPYNNFWER